MLCRDELILLSATDLRELADDGGPLQRTHDWVVEFLCAPNAKLGRHGLVCPFTKPSLDNDLFFLAMPMVGPGDTRKLEAVVGRYKEWFVELRGRTAEGQRHLVTLVLVLPDFAGAHVHELDDVQQRLKDDFVGEGLMIGEFYPECPVPGLWSSTFRPLAAPEPLLAMREMVSSDLPFLVGCPAHASAYLDRYGHGIPSHMRRFLVQRVVDVAPAQPAPPDPAHPAAGPVSDRLDGAGIDHLVHHHRSMGRPIRSPGDMAAALGYPPDRIAKTLLVVDRSDRARAALVTLAAVGRVDFASVASILGWSGAAMARPEELDALLGQEPGGVSPINERAIPVVIDEALLDRPTMLVGGGVPGVEIELSPADLIRITGAVPGPIASRSVAAVPAAPAASGRR